MNYTMTPLEWDSNFFECNCLKLSLLEDLNNEERSKVESEIQKYNFITITNDNGRLANTRWLSESLKAYLVDLNVTFSRSPLVKTSEKDYDSCIYIVKADETDKIDDALNELGENEFSEEEIRLVRIKFLSEMGN